MQEEESGKLRYFSRLSEASQPWKMGPSGEYLPTIPSMISIDEARYLFWLCSEYLRGDGCIVDLGPLGGGSTHAMAAGLDLNSHPQARRGVIHSYDLWRYVPDWAHLFPGCDMDWEDDALPHFLENLGLHSARARPTKGDLLKTTWTAGPIELLFIDAAKSAGLMHHICREFFPALVPGRSVVVEQDYISAECPWIHLAHEALSDYFEVVDSPFGGTVAFINTRQISRGALDDLLAPRSAPESALLFANATERLCGWPRLCVKLAKAHHMALVGELTAAREELYDVERSHDMAPNVDYDLNLVKAAINRAT